MSFETISLNTDYRGVSTLSLNRPEKHNAMSGQMIDELALAADQLTKDNQTRVVVLTGAGESFCAGGDLEWMRIQFDADRHGRISEATKLAKMLFALNTIPKPLIGRIQGSAYGGGVGLMCVCDVVIGVDSAKFGLTETRLGLIPATISPYVIARMGEAKARRVFMSSRRFGADEAIELGLLAKTVSPADLEEAIEREVLPYLSTAPGAVASAKALARHLGPAINEDVITETATRLANAWEQPEAKEGISAFFEKRHPSWINQ